MSILFYLLGNYKYYVSGYYIPGIQSTTITPKRTTLLQETLYTDSLDLPSNPPDINVVTEYINPLTGGTDYNRMATDGIRNCIIKTTAPTSAPTNIPSITPTKTPTNYPSKSLTQRPTYSAQILNQCKVDMWSVIMFLYFEWSFTDIEHATSAIIILTYDEKRETISVSHTALPYTCHGKLIHLILI